MNLNKENFWNELAVKYPVIHKEFCTWIDQYKERVNWKLFFVDGIKFHDIPLEMQVGIIEKFIVDMTNSQEEYANVIASMMDVFGKVELQILPPNNIEQK